MMRRAIVVVGLVAALTSFGVVAPVGATVQPPCKITGAGITSDGSWFLVRATANRHGEQSGVVTIVSPSGDWFVGSVEAFHGRRDGGGGPELNVGDLEGAGYLNGQAGQFAAAVQDHGGGPPEQLADVFVIDAMADSGPPIYRAGGVLVCGDVQIRPPSP